MVELLYPHLILWACTHNSAGLLSAELGDGAIQHVDLVEEVHRVHRHPPDRQGSIVHSWYFGDYAKSIRCSYSLMSSPSGSITANLRFP